MGSPGEGSREAPWPNMVLRSHRRWGTSRGRPVGCERGQRSVHRRRRSRPNRSPSWSGAGRLAVCPRLSSRPRLCRAAREADLAGTQHHRPPVQATCSLRSGARRSPAALARRRAVSAYCCLAAWQRRNKPGLKPPDPTRCLPVPRLSTAPALVAATRACTSAGPRARGGEKPGHAVLGATGVCAYPATG